MKPLACYFITIKQILFSYNNNNKYNQHYGKKMEYAVNKFFNPGLGSLRKNDTAPAAAPDLFFS